MSHFQSSSYRKANDAYITLEIATSAVPVDTHLRWSVNPTIWGPGFWYMLHNRSWSYPLEPTPAQQSEMSIFLRVLPAMLPCGWCQKHAREYLTERDTVLDTVVKSRAGLSRFFVEFHNSVNFLNSKPLFDTDAVVDAIVKQKQLPVDRPVC